MAADRRARTAYPLARSVLTVADPAGESVQVEVVVCREHDWPGLPESREAGWHVGHSCAGLDVNFRVVN